MTPAAQLNALEAKGLLTPQVSRGSKTYSDADLELLQVIHDARTLGLGEIFPMEILEPYVIALRELVRMELGLFRHRIEAGVTMPDMPLPDLAQAAMRLAERMIVALRRKLVVLEVRNPVKPKKPPRRQKKWASAR